MTCQISPAGWLKSPQTKRFPQNESSVIFSKLTPPLKVALWCNDIYDLLSTEAGSFKISCYCSLFFFSFLPSFVFSDQIWSVLSYIYSILFLFFSSSLFKSVSPELFPVHPHSLIHKARGPRRFSFEPVVNAPCVPVLTSTAFQKFQVLRDLLSPLLTFPSPDPLTYTLNQTTRAVHIFLWGLCAFLSLGLGLNYSFLECSPLPQISL